MLQEPAFLHLRIWGYAANRLYIDHSIGAKVLVAVQGPWRLSARADRKTHTEAHLKYTHTVILVTDGEVERGR